MKDTLSINDVMNTLVPITRFNKGEANKIFEEVKEEGVKLVIKNNSPSCVLINPEKYEAMVEALEDYALYFEAEERMKNVSKDGLLSEEQVMDELGITEADLDGVEVEIE
ncbi:type II toxin-antitoxin system Phd/YefM family antitoxin [Aminipila sp.]|uniref:type II toxin-antitoxin system Phd/YefM family antitoxin n=1 Tax=Aminipila sp. TaxID=2060095 RepID=UPI0028A16E13|nr:type II toxin-antitoxin system Phd/YefM family antitoxin [Aminipila sp.]